MMFFRVLVAILCIPVLLTADIALMIIELSPMRPPHSQRLALLFSVCSWGFVYYAYSREPMIAATPFDNLNVELEVVVRFEFLGLAWNVLKTACHLGILLSMLTLKCIWSFLSRPHFFLLSLLFIGVWVRV